MARTIQLQKNEKEFPSALIVKNLHQFSPHYERERRYPFLVAIDLTVHCALSLAAVVLTAIALRMAFDTVLPLIVQWIGR